LCQLFGGGRSLGGRAFVRERQVIAFWIVGLEESGLRAVSARWSADGRAGPTIPLKHPGDFVSAARSTQHIDGPVRAPEWC